MALRRTFRVAPLFPLLLAAAACVPQDGAPKAANTIAPAASLASRPPGRSIAANPTAPKPSAASVATTDLTAQPRMATYNCADGGRMTIENLGTSVRVLGPDGVSEDLPASPANQSSRFGEAHDAIVIDGRDALVMKGGATPLTCTR
jgi:hypothetical protein